MFITFGLFEYPFATRTLHTTYIIFSNGRIARPSLADWQIVAGGVWNDAE